MVENVLEAGFSVPKPCRSARKTPCRVVVGVRARGQKERDRLLARPITPRSIPRSAIVSRLSGTNKCVCPY